MNKITVEFLQNCDEFGFVEYAAVMEMVGYVESGLVESKGFKSIYDFDLGDYDRETVEHFLKKYMNFIGFMVFSSDNFNKILDARTEEDSYDQLYSLLSILLDDDKHELVVEASEKHMKED